MALSSVISSRCYLLFMAFIRSRRDLGKSSRCGSGSGEGDLLTNAFFMASKGLVSGE